MEQEIELRLAQQDIDLAKMLTQLASSTDKCVAILAKAVLELNREKVLRPRTVDGLLILSETDTRNEGASPER